MSASFITITDLKGQEWTVNTLHIVTICPPTNGCKRIILTKAIDHTLPDIYVSEDFQLPTKIDWSIKNNKLF